VSIEGKNMTYLTVATTRLVGHELSFTSSSQALTFVPAIPESISSSKALRLTEYIEVLSIVQKAEAHKFEHFSCLEILIMEDFTLAKNLMEI